MDLLLVKLKNSLMAKLSIRYTVELIRTVPISFLKASKAKPGSDGDFFLLKGNFQF